MELSASCSSAPQRFRSEKWLEDPAQDFLTHTRAIIGNRNAYVAARGRGSVKTCFVFLKYRRLSGSLFRFFRDELTLIKALPQFVGESSDSAAIGLSK